MSTAKDGSYGLDMFKELGNKPCCNQSYRLVIMDINMPIMDGVTATRNILQYCQDSNITPPTICALTAYDDPNLRTDCLKAGMKRILCKPLSLREFKTVMETYYFG